ARRTPENHSPCAASRPKLAWRLAGPSQPSGLSARLGGLTGSAAVSTCCQPSSGTAAHRCWHSNSKAPTPAHPTVELALCGQAGEVVPPVTPHLLQVASLAAVPPEVPCQPHGEHLRVRALGGPTRPARNAHYPAGGHVVDECRELNEHAHQWHHPWCGLRGEKKLD